MGKNKKKKSNGISNKRNDVPAAAVSSPKDNVKRSVRSNNNNSMISSVRTTALSAFEARSVRSTTSTTNSKTSVSVTLPLAFPSHLPKPKGAFLREGGDCEQGGGPLFGDSFRAAMETSYEGFAVDGPETFLDQDFAESMDSAMDVLEEQGFFRSDVTQPFGLGTKCAKTYVTRCLLGDSGTTYKYLGLRMFAFPWNHPSSSRNSIDQAVSGAVRTISILNEKLTARTRLHLEKLSAQRGAGGRPPCQGRAGFDVVLINRMTASKHLKPEASVGEKGHRCSVSWHADSSLEHYSSIAVHHILRPPHNKDAWSVALRVAHYSEGPTASRRGSDIESNLVLETPPVAVSLPSRATYYLLDDFNHHHQHAVLAKDTDNGTTSTTKTSDDDDAEEEIPVRYSLTHRLLRSSHNVADTLERCRRSVSQFHRKGPKLWRSEQLLLTELESEWIRQYFIQGSKHHALLWPAWWQEPMQQLLSYWRQLETRTKSVVDLLKQAARGACNSNTNINNLASRQERKYYDKCKKAVSTLQDIVQREDHQQLAEQQGDAASVAAAATAAESSVYEPLVGLFLERARMRENWIRREKDHVFYELEPCHRPLPVPFLFADDEFSVTKEEEGGGGGGDPSCDVPAVASPLPQGLRPVCEDLRACGRAWVSKDASHLDQVIRTKAEQCSDDHTKPATWSGFASGHFGLELQSPWAERLLEGKKTIETRAYALPDKLVGRRIEILRSASGEAGVSTLGNSITIHGVSAGSGVQLLGWCTFTRMIEYRDRTGFQADEKKHLVARDSGYSWKEETKVIYGWEVGECGWYKDPLDFGNTTLIVRRLRSIFEFQQSSYNSQAAVSEHPPSSNTGKKKRKKKPMDKSPDKKKHRY
jgi:FTO catalytic domain/FTO C-terminal domain